MADVKQAVRKIGSWVNGRLRDRSVRQALFVFTLTRSLIFLILILVGQFTTETITSEQAPTYPLAVQEATINLKNRTIGRRFRETLAKGDINIYMSLATHGYEKHRFDITKRASHFYAFFPLFPLLLRSLSWISNDLVILGTVLSNVLFLFALIILHRLVTALGYKVAVADRTLFYLAIFPTSYFFSVPMTESLFLFLTVASFYAAARERWWLAGIMGALCAVCRSNGVLLLPALVVLYWQRQGFRIALRHKLALLLIPLGLVSYMAFCWWMTGSPLAFVSAQASWGKRFGFFLMPLIEYLMTPSQVAVPWNFMLLNFAAGVLSLIAVYLLGKQRAWALAVYLVLSILMPLSTLTLLSVTRYVSVFFPVFIGLAYVGETRHRLDQAICFVFALLLALMTALFASHVTFAVA